MSEAFIKLFLILGISHNFGGYSQSPGFISAHHSRFPNFPFIQPASSQVLQDLPQIMQRGLTERSETTTLAYRAATTKGSMIGLHKPKRDAMDVITLIPRLSRDDVRIVPVLVY